MNTTTPKDAEALLLAFANMLNEFYGPEDDGNMASPAPEPSATRQAGLEFDLAPESKQADQPSGRGPWEDIDITKKMGVSIQVMPELYKKMIWLTENVPQMSHQKLTRMGLEAEVERLLERHYRPE
ncbi:MAG: hypothetical protein V4508_15865 [Pseudomonadota bacterium]